MLTDSLIPTFNRVLAFDRDLTRLVSQNGNRSFVPSLDVIERSDVYLINCRGSRRRPGQH